MEMEQTRQAKRGLASATGETRVRVAREGGVAPHNIRGLAAATSETRSRVAKAGGEARSHDKDGLREAGKKGGEIVKAEYGHQFYQTIGERGGESVKQKYGIEFYREIGVKGGGIVREKYGPEFFSLIGRRGGETAKHGRRATNWDVTDGSRVPENEESHQKV